MAPKVLEPNLEILSQEYVLIQAWKKTVRHIRSHNSFADTLVLDYATVNLQTFLEEIQKRLKESPDSWRNDPLRIVPAPKSQSWAVHEGVWKPGPAKEGKTSSRLRPLAHVSLPDQVMATALMLCLADRVETLQGDPRVSVHRPEKRKQVTSYGNRLFCDDIRGKLRHRWGSAKLYRAYFQDYRTFLTRSEIVADEILKKDEKQVYIIESDLQQFYDRVRPDSLIKSIAHVCPENTVPEFFSLAKSVFDWGWHLWDEDKSQNYAEKAGFGDFTRVALPQGLVASGFFANLFLIQFDNALREAIGTEISSGIWLEDVCRYVDDLRLVVRISQDFEDATDDKHKNKICDWLQERLKENTQGLALSSEKSHIRRHRGEQPVVRHREKMNRIQSAVSGGFDSLGGWEILDAIKGLMRSQDALGSDGDSGWKLAPIPDVKDATVARFSANRYRTTFRSLRPLLEDDPPDNAPSSDTDDTRPVVSWCSARTCQELDEDVQIFAHLLIKKWVEDPSNIRLLRIGLDLWPDAEVLCSVLSLLRPLTENTDEQELPRYVAWYCLAEVLLAGATETGMVQDTDSLPSNIDLQLYRKELCSEASRLVNLPDGEIPWYLRQQALLFLASHDPHRIPLARIKKVPELQYYHKLIQFLSGNGNHLPSADFATFAVLARRTFMDRDRAVELTRAGLNPSRKRELARRDPSFLVELLEDDTNGSRFKDLPARILEDICLSRDNSDGVRPSLAKEVLYGPPNGLLRNELSLLRFACAFLEEWNQLDSPPEVITPVQVILKLDESQEIAAIGKLQIRSSQASVSGSLYQVPSWCDDDEQWRFQLGFLLRFILSRHQDFTCTVRQASWKESQPIYRPIVSHWYQRLYGLYNGQQAFGDDWVPITDWVEEFLFALLSWPGCRISRRFKWIRNGIEETMSKIKNRMEHLEQQYGKAAGVLVMPLQIKPLEKVKAQRPFYACVVQTVIPKDRDFKINDLALNDSETRRKHRNHLSAALSAVERMLILRETHIQKDRKGHLDWLILPELSVHPKDVKTHLIPFVRKHKTIILAGLTYEKIPDAKYPVNSALWIIPERSDTGGFQIKTRRQGKKHLAPNEKNFGDEGNFALQGFRPCQWLIGYPHCGIDSYRPAWLTTAISYDATDLALISDLRDKSDILAIPALNQDIQTFDQMSLALYYHMFQLVIVANNGEYGGSSAFWPVRNAKNRRIFHTHGQPQASIFFFEINDMGTFLKRLDMSAANEKDWKFPPAGLILTDGLQ